MSSKCKVLALIWMQTCQDIIDKIRFIKIVKLWIYIYIFLDNMDRGTLWNLLPRYFVSDKIVNIIHCEVVHEEQIRDEFQVKTSISQGCLLSPFLFLSVVDWIMKTSTSQKKHGIRWTCSIRLKDMDLVDDLALLSHTHKHLTEKLWKRWRHLSTCVESLINRGDLVQMWKFLLSKPFSMFIGQCLQMLLQITTKLKNSFWMSITNEPQITFCLI